VNQTPQIIRCVAERGTDEKAPLPAIRQLIDHSAAGPYLIGDAVQIPAHHGVIAKWSAEEILRAFPADPEQRLTRNAADRIGETPNPKLMFLDREDWDAEDEVDGWDYATREDTATEIEYHARCYTGLRIGAHRAGHTGLPIADWNRPIEVNSRVRWDTIERSHLLTKPDAMIANLYRDRGKDERDYFDEAYRQTKLRSDLVYLAVAPYTPSAKWISHAHARRVGEFARDTGAPVLLYITTGMFVVKGDEPGTGDDKVLAYIDALVEGMTA
jgi:hypothetical protein